jgi:glycosyltransferase involved in cell wall biosynthesis
MQMPVAKASDLSVVVPAFNAAGFLPQALESVLSQSPAPARIVVVDDGSTDGTPGVVARYAPRVECVRLPHRGIVAVRQHILSLVETPWFFNLDADNLLPPGFFRRTLPVLASLPPSVAFAYLDVATFGDYERLQPAPDFSLDALQRGPCVDMNAFFRLDPARRAGFDPFFERGWEDYDFVLRLVELGFTGRRIPGIPVRYRVHAASRTAAIRGDNPSSDLMRAIVERHPSLFPPPAAAAALARFTPDAAVRLDFSKALWAGAYARAAGLLVRHPLPFLRAASARLSHRREVIP